MTQTYTLKLVKSTSGTHVYGETDKPRGEAVFPALYLPKGLFPHGATKSVTVTLTIDAGDVAPVQS
jgi:hypothetical protein